MSKVSLDKGAIKVLLLESVDPGAVESFRSDGYTSIELVKGSLPEDQLAERVRDVHLLGIRSRTRVTAKVLEQARKVIAVGCFCIGTNQVDLLAAEDRGIPVFNAPFSNTRSVAELVLAEIILLLRGIPRRNAAAHRGEWLKSAAGAREVRGKCLGIVGYGHIGTQVGLLAEALGMHVVFYDIASKLTLGNATALESLDAVLARGDVVTLHVPQTPQTHRMIGAPQLEQMRPGSSLINASRGTVVDLEALDAALRSGHLAGAAIDVYPEEPESPTDRFESSLRELDNVVLTPHIAGSTVEAQQNIALEVSAKLIKYSNNGSTTSAVNFPDVSLPEHRGRHRFLHIHRNQPGMLSRVNEVFSHNRVNVASQFLQTDSRIGYVVIDVDVDEGSESMELKRQLAEIDGTIKTRLLY